MKKRKKQTRHRGNTTAGRGARKKGRGSGERGGVGMAGSGKRADHKKTLVLKKYKQYFGTRGFTSASSIRKKNPVLNLEDIQKNLKSMIARGDAKKTSEGFEINLKDYKILSRGEIKEKLIIRAKAFSKAAKEKVEKAGGKLE